MYIIFEYSDQVNFLGKNINSKNEFKNRHIGQYTNQSRSKHKYTPITLRNPEDGGNMFSET
jgi:hypothetical protein